MSSHRLRFTADARNDLRDIRRYTTRQWGEQQRDTYLAKLDRALHSLTAYPELGRPRPEICPGCRSFVVEHHVVVYRLDESDIVIGRVLHAKRGPQRNVDC